jgi:hypothetical protein
MAHSGHSAEWGSMAAPDPKRALEGLLLLAHLTPRNHGCELAAHSLMQPIHEGVHFALYVSLIGAKHIVVRVR